MYKLDVDDTLPNINLQEFLLWLLRFRRRFRVTGNSMLPVLKPDDEVLINPNAYRHVPPRPGDLVIAQHPYRPKLRIIKRVSTITTDGKYTLEGDNPLESTDSRIFGPVASEYILGQVTCRFA